MASADTNRLLESPTSIQASISQRLAEDGLEEDCSTEEKLIYIWRLFQKAEEALAVAQDAEKKLKQGQAEEMQEVENYVEHIRHLSDEREALIQELEAENDNLKSEIEGLRQGEASSTLRKETAEMLVQQGLDEIANASSSEQIAFLLVERARLLDELESADRSAAPSEGAPASDGRDSAELKEILNRERTEFEEELQQQRESSRLMTESMRQEHEEEISALMEENQRLEEDYNAQKEKVQALAEDLEKEQALREKERTAWQTENDELRTMINTLRNELEEAKAQAQAQAQAQAHESKERESPRTPVQGRPPSPLSRTPSDVALTKIIAEKTKIESEILPLKAQLRKLEQESSEKDNKLTQLRAEVEKAVMQQQQVQMKYKNLKQDLEEVEQQLDEAEAELEKVKRERTTLQEKLTSLQEEVKSLRSDAAKGSTLQDVVDILKNDKQSLVEQVESLQRELREEKKAEETLQAERLSLTQAEFDLSNELRELREQVESLKTEKELLVLEKEGLTDSQREQAESLRKLRSELEEQKTGRQEAEARGERLDKENKELQNSLKRLEAEAESSKSASQTLAQQEITVKHMREQNQRLNTELAELKSQVEYLKQEKKVLEEKQAAQKTAHEDTEKKHQEDLKDLRDKLQLTLTELSKAKASLEQEKTEKSALNERLQSSQGQEQEALEREKTEKAALQVKLRDLESQLAELKEAADSFEEERDQRLELERKLRALTDANESLTRTKERLEQENRARQSQDAQLKELGRLKEQLSSAQEELEKEQRARRNWEVKAADLQQSLEDLRLDSEGVQQSLSAKVKSLEKRVTSLQEDLFAAQDELQSEQEKCAQIEKEKERLRASVKEKEAEAEREVMELKEKHELEISDLLERLDAVERESEERLEASRKEWEEALQSRGAGTAAADERDGGPTETQMAAAAGTTASSGYGEEEEEEGEEMDGTVHLSGSAGSLRKVLADAASQTEGGSGLDRSKEAESQAQRQAKSTSSAACQTEPQAQAPQPKTSASRSVSCQTDRESQSPLSKPGGAESPAEVKETPASEEIVQQQTMATLQAGSPVTTPRRQLEDTLRMLDLSKSRETQLLTDLEISSRNVDQTRRLLEQTTLRLEECEHEKMAATKTLAEKQTTVELLKLELEEARRRGEELREDRRELQQELDAVQALAAGYPAQERQQLLDRISTLERQLQALELDHREVARKLLDTSTKLEMAEDSLQREKLRNSDKLQRSSQYVRQLEDDLDAANKQIRGLREELHSQQTAVFKLEADSAGQTAKYESQISRLEAEIKDLKTHHKREQDTWHARIEEAHAEARECRNIIRNKEQDVMERMQELSKANATVERLQQQLKNETQLRTDYENRNKTLDQEMTKVWSQVRSLMEKNADLESTKRSVEEDLERNLSSTRALETSYKQRISNDESALRAAVNRAESAERKVESLQRELEGVRSQLSGADQQLQQAESSKYELQEKSDAIIHIRNQLEGEKLQRTLLDQTVSELKHQTSLLKQREGKVAEENRQLQHTILDLESRLGVLQESSDSTMERVEDEQRQLNEVGKKSMADQITRLQKEMKQLQFELLAASEKREVDERRYEDRKRRTKVKLMRAREIYNGHKSYLQEQMEQMDEDLRLTRATLRKEMEWKEKMDTNYKHLLQEKRELITRLTEQDEAIRDQARTLAMLQVRCKYLEEENLRQQDHIDSLTRQHQCLDKYIKDPGKDVEDARGESPGGMTAGTSGLGTSMTSSWEPDRLADQTFTVTNGLRQGRGAFSGHVIDLYASPEMDATFGDEFEA